jgi:hypothetical protein
MRRHRLVSDRDHPIGMRCIPGQLRIWSTLSGSALAREEHFPATIADLYDPQKIPDNLRQAHEHSDEVLERIYIGRRFRNDTERLERLFDLYTKMTANQGTTKKRKAGVNA